MIAPNWCLVAVMMSLMKSDGDGRDDEGGPHDEQTVGVLMTKMIVTTETGMGNTK